MIPPGDGLLLVREGQVRLETIDGRVIETVAVGGCFAEESCLGHLTPAWRAVAMTATELTRFPAGDLCSIPIVLWKLLELYNRRLCLAKPAA